MAKTEAKKKEVSKDEAKKLLDWLHTMELTWIALILSCVVGLVGLLSEIRYYGSSPGGIALTSLLVFLALIFIGHSSSGLTRLSRRQKPE